MNFVDAVRSVLTQYVGFSGRARRSEYWWFILFYFIVYLVAVILDAGVGTTYIFTTIVALGLFLPNLAVAIRRLHDTDRSGWWVLISLIPLVGAIILLIFYCTDGTPGPNRFGESPKQPGPGYAPPQYGAPA